MKISVKKDLVQHLEEDGEGWALIQERSFMIQFYLKSLKKQLIMTRC